MKSPQFFLDYVAIVVGVFIKSCRTLPELEYLCQRHYASFRDPVVRRDVDQHNVRALYRYVIHDRLILVHENQLKNICSPIKMCLPAT